MCNIDMQRLEVLFSGVRDCFELSTVSAKNKVRSDERPVHAVNH